MGGATKGGAATDVPGAAPRAGEATRGAWGGGKGYLYALASAGSRACPRGGSRGADAPLRRFRKARRSSQAVRAASEDPLAGTRRRAQRRQPPAPRGDLGRT